MKIFFDSKEEKEKLINHIDSIQKCFKIIKLDNLLETIKNAKVLHNTDIVNVESI